MQVTLANWRSSPFHHWAFHHVRELIPTADIANDPGRIRALEPGAVDSTSLGLEAFIRETDTDGMAIVHRGRLVFERYANGMSDETPHILMSVSKSMMGMLVEILAESGVLRLDALVSDIVPEAEATAYRGATLRHLLDMRVGIVWDEDYLATTGPIVQYRKATGWNALGPGETAGDLHSFYRELTGSRPHGGPLHYVSPNSDLLGWVIERATGRRYAELMSELVWKPLGAERSAYITVDRLGAPRTAGGMCVTLRDLARVGQFIIEKHPAWFDRIVKEGDAQAWARGDLAQYFAGLPIRYRSQWYALDGEAPLAFGLGIHGQNLFIDRANEIVIAKFSSQALPLDAARIALTMRAVSRLRKLLA